MEIKQVYFTFAWRNVIEITEETVREISRLAMKHLGPGATPAMVKKIVTEVVRRLQAEKR